MLPVVLPQIDLGKTTNELRESGKAWAGLPSTMGVIVAVLDALRVHGDFVECGTAQGGTAWLIALLAQSRIVHVFDTLQGFPGRGMKADERHLEGLFKYDPAEVRRFLGERPNIVLHEGFFPDTAPEIADRKLAFIHADIDTEVGHEGIFDHLWPQLVPGGIIVFDDYYCPDCPGTKRSVDRFRERVTCEWLHYGVQPAIRKLPLT